MNLALFDFDHTISKKDSFIPFIIYAQGFMHSAWGFILLSPILILYRFKIIPNWKTKQKVFQHFFSNWEEEKFFKYGKDYALQGIPKIIKQSAVDKLDWHKEKGDKIIVISASFKTYLKPWCEANNFELICTEAEISNNILTGKFATKNCYGEEKIKRLEKIYNLSDFEYIYGYGDSKGDLGIKRVSNEFHYRSFT